MERVRFNPYPVIREVVQVLGVKANEKGIGLDFMLEDDVPDTIEGDPGRIRQIVTNLVGNAVKFTERGGVTVTAYGKRLGHDKLQFHVDVADTGIGMDAEAAARIFEDFVQADASVTRKFGGTGLGLSISRKFAQALGGDITVESTPGVGSVFKVTLDAGSTADVTWVKSEQVMAEADATIAPASANYVFAPAQILVVDDGPENRQLVKVVLEDYGLTVDEAANGRIGVDMATATDYDVILMDLQMPEMDGFTAARLLRHRGLKTPIVALTANAMKGFEQECLDAGFTEYLTKPIDIDRFVSKLARMLDAQPVEAQPAEPAMPEPQEQAPVSKAADTSPIFSKLGGNPRFARVISSFVERLGGQLRAMEEAHSDGDMTALAKLAHWLKGAGGTVGFDIFNEPAAELESAAKASDLAAIERRLRQIHELAARVAIDDQLASADRVETASSFKAVG